MILHGMDFKAQKVLLITKQACLNMGNLWQDNIARRTFHVPLQEDNILSERFPEHTSTNSSCAREVSSVEMETNLHICRKVSLIQHAFAITNGTSFHAHNSVLVMIYFWGPHLRKCPADYFDLFFTNRQSFFSQREAQRFPQPIFIFVTKFLSFN